MRAFTALLFCLTYFSFASFTQIESGWTIYNNKGKSISAKQVAKKMKSAEVVFFGEEHDNTVAHYLSLHLLGEFVHHHENPVFALEMFETNQQAGLDALCEGKFPTRDLHNAIDLWSNFVDYQPMLDTALSLNVPIIASNVPRPWASALFHGGRDSLRQVVGTDTALVCPLDFKVDFTLSQYAKLEEMAVHMGKDKHFVEAQAIKDATMAKMIAQQVKQDHTVFHLNGCYHSDFYQGIVWYLKAEMPDVDITTISVVTSATLEWNPEWLNKADIIIVVDETFPRSY